MERKIIYVTDGRIFHTCPECGMDNITRAFNRCIDCGALIKWVYKVRVGGVGPDKVSNTLTGSATFTGFSVEEIKKMVDAGYGGCVWERVTEKGINLLFCAPSSTGEVRIFDK